MTNRSASRPTTHARPARVGGGPVVAPPPAPAVRVPQHLRAPATGAGRRRLPAVAGAGLVVAACLGLAVWGGQDDRGGAAPAGVAARALAGTGHTTPPEPTARVTDAGQLRSAVVTALSEHLVLTDRLARAGLRGERDLAAAADLALERSSRTWRTALSVLSADAAHRGEQASTGSLTAVFVYAAARADGDAGAATDARARVATQARDLSRVLVDAADGALDAGTTERGLQQYAAGLVRHVDAAARGDFLEAYEEERRTYAYSSHLGSVLAEGLAEGLGLDPPARSADDQQRLHLQRLLAEHAALALDVVAAQLRAGTDATAATAALRANGTELAWAAGQDRDAPATARFARLWQRRIDALVTYSRALAADQPTAARDALADVARTSRQVVELLEPGRGQTSGTLLPSLRQQDQLLARQVADLAAADGPAAQRGFGEAMDHGHELGSQLAAVLSGPPRGGVPTGGP